MKEKHTPAPWIAQNHYVVTDRHEQLEVVAVVGGRETLNFACDPGDVENTANTKLIAAAPELLEACKAALKTIEIICKYRNPKANGGAGIATTDEQITIEMLRVAIASAEGKP